MEGKDAPIVNRSPQDAQDNGISTVYQEVNLCPNLTVAEICLSDVNQESRPYRLEDNEQEIYRAVKGSAD